MLLVLLVDVIYATFPVATVATPAQRLTPAMVVMVMVHVVRRGHVVMVMVVMPVAVVLRVRLRRTAGHLEEKSQMLKLFKVQEITETYPILTRGPYLGQRADAVPTLIAAAIGAAVVIDQVTLFHVQVQLQDALLAAGELLRFGKVSLKIIG